MAINDVIRKNTASLWVRIKATTSRRIMGNIYPNLNSQLTGLCAYTAWFSICCLCPLIIKFCTYLCCCFNLFGLPEQLVLLSLNSNGYGIAEPSFLGGWCPSHSNSAVLGRWGQDSSRVMAEIPDQGDPAGSPRRSGGWTWWPRGRPPGRGPTSIGVHKEDGSSTGSDSREFRDAANCAECGWRLPRGDLSTILVPGRCPDRGEVSAGLQSGH